MIGVLLFPTLAIMNRSFARRMEGPARRAQERIGDVSSVAHESIDGAMVVKTLGREDEETERLAAKARALRDERVQAGYIRAGFEPALEALPAVGAVALLAVGSWRVSAGAVTRGDLSSSSRCSACSRGRCASSDGSSPSSREPWSATRA